jgi:hypothetical protein
VRGEEKVTRGRVNVRHPELEGMGMAMGVTLLDAPRLEVTSFDAGTLRGRLFTETPIADGRIAGKTIEYAATFSAPIGRQ